MPAIFGPHPAVPTGSVGNNTGAATQVSTDADSHAVEFIVEAAGATPTVTFSVDGSFDGTNFFPIGFTDSNANAFATTKVVTAVGRYVVFIAGFAGNERFFQFLRVNTAANTNITYRASIWGCDSE